MPGLTVQRRDLLDGMADEFLHHYRRGRTFLAVDGVEGSGSAAFADDLAARLGRDGHGVARASIDAFLRPRAERGREAAGYYRDAFDYDLFRRILIEPFRLGGSTGFTTAAFDWRRDVPLQSEWRTAPQDATLVVDGVFLNRPELHGLWHWSIRLDVDADTARRRLAADHGPVPAPVAEAAQSLYGADLDPRAVASAVVDVDDPDAPTRVLIDRC